jgi:thioredoxin-like negative regulator of GroEL
VSTGDLTKGTPLLKMASSLAPTNNDIRLHYAKALVKSGDKVNARAQLDILTKLDSASPVRVEADKLMADL